jgi:hypothetical protein
MNIWAVCCIFNYTPSHYRDKNYKIFRENLKKHDIKLLTVEFDPNGVFKLTENDAEKLIQLKDGDILWQKERLLNIGIDNLPKNTDIVLILDTDIIFSEKNTVDKIKKAMEQYKIVQCFSRNLQLNPLLFLNENNIDFFNIDNSINYFFYGNDNSSYMKKFFEDKKFGNTGLAWAFRYETLKKIRLFEMNIAGSGDYAMVCAFTRVFKKPHIITGTGNSWFLYSDLVRKHVKPEEVNYIEDTILYSLYHGERENRNYITRHDLLIKYNFDSTKQLIIREGLPFKFTEDVDPLMVEEMKQYFLGRRENDPIIKPPPTLHELMGCNLTN